MVDTSVLVAGIAAFKPAKRTLSNASGLFLREWIEQETFIWLLTEEIIAEYKEVLARLRVPPSVIGRAINLIREDAEQIFVSRTADVSPDPGDDPFCACAEQGKADFIVTLNRKDFPQNLLSAHVIGPEQTIPTTGRKKRPQKAEGKSTK